MLQESLTPQNKHTILLSPKEHQNSFRNSMHSTSKQRSLLFSQKQSEPHQEDEMDRYGKMYFKQKMSKMNELKFSKTKRQTNNNTNKKAIKIQNNDEIIDKNSTNLQKIDEKLSKDLIFNQINNNNSFYHNKETRSLQSFLFPRSPKMNTIKSPIKNLHSLQKKHQQLQSMNQSAQMSRITQNQQLISQTQPLSNQFLQPISLKKKLNLIRKHKQFLQDEFHRRRASLQFKQRSVARQQKKVSAYRSKFQKIINARQQRSLQRSLNEREIQCHEKQIMEEKYYLRSTVLDTQDNLQSSRLSLCIAKMNLANETRVQKRNNLQQVKQFESYTLSQKKRRCDSVRSSKIKTQQSVESFNFDKRMTINQLKLQEISQQLVSLEKQKNLYSTFYKEKDGNELYKSRIKQKKQDLQKKAKLYKINLMLELNRNDRIKLKNQEENQITELKNSTTTQLYRKKRHTVSTQPDLNLLTTAKNNSIYKRWGNSILSNCLNEQLEVD